MIDPIPIGEELRRIKLEGLELRKREHAAVALEWFSEYALTKADGKPRVPANGVLGDKLTPIASSTPRTYGIRTLASGLLMSTGFIPKYTKADPLAC